MRFSVFLLALAALPATAQESAPRNEAYLLDGVELRLVETDEPAYELRHGDKVLFSDYMFHPEGEVRKVAGHDVQVFLAGPGGNTCDSMPLVAWVDQGEPKVDGPLEGCLPYSVFPWQGKGLLFQSPALPLVEGENWVWQPGTGMVEQNKTAFTDILYGSWPDLIERKPSHPLEALENAALWEHLSQGMGANFQSFLEVVDGIGSGGVVQDRYSGSVCSKWECEEVFAHLWVDAGQGAAYVIWRSPEMEEFSFYPAPMEDWPEWAVIKASETLGLN